MVAEVSLMKLPSDECHKTLLMIDQRWFRWGLEVGVGGWGGGGSCCFTSIRISIIKLRHSYNHINSIRAFPLPVRTVFILKWAHYPCMLLNCFMSIVWAYLTSDCFAPSRHETQATTPDDFPNLTATDDDVNSYTDKIASLYQNGSQETNYHSNTCIILWFSDKLITQIFLITKMNHYFVGTYFPWRVWHMFGVTLPWQQRQPLDLKPAVPRDYLNYHNHSPKSHLCNWIIKQNCTMLLQPAETKPNKRRAQITWTSDLLINDQWIHDRPSKSQITDLQSVPTNTPVTQDFTWQILPYRWVSARKM